MPGPVRVPRALLPLVLCGLVVCSGCGSIGEPLPPALHLPTRVSDVSAVERGSRIIVQFTMPKTTTEGLPLKDPPETELYIGASGGTFDQHAWAETALRITDDTGKQRFEIPIKDFVGKNVAIALRLKNDRGHDAGWSNFVQLPVTSTVGRPENVTPESTAQGIRLTWTGSAPLFRVYRKDTADSDFAPLGDTAALSYVDTTAEYAKPYQYFVQGLQKSGDQISESDVSDTVSYTASDTFPPAVPSGLRTIVGTKTVELSWNRNTEPDLAGYRVYRAEGDGPSQVVAAALTGPSYSDHDVKSGGRYRYRVLAFDQVGNPSDLSAPVEAQVP
jgi:hypothetical protein